MSAEEFAPSAAPVQPPAAPDAGEVLESEPVPIPDVPARFEPPADGRRLMITKMVLENFKSYAGVKEIGPFHHCFSAVVGPNGSGKSNVIDAMLFVFGKRAKKLRLNKVAELIHNSEQHPDCEYAKVSVYFQDIIDAPTEDNPEAFTAVEGTSLVVSRTARRDSSSRYEVDGRTMTFTDVMALLRLRGIDLDNNRFLILQGEIEQIAMMKPKAQTQHEDGLLEYLEDIIGSNRFIEAAEAAQAEADRLAETRAQHLQRVKGAEVEKDNLEVAKVEAEAFVAKERAVCRKRNTLFQCERRDARALAADAAGKAAQLRERLEREAGKLQTAEGRLAEVETRFGAADEEHKTLDAELARIKTSFAAYERQDIKLREDVRHAGSQKDALKAKAKKEAKKGADLQAKAAALAADDLPRLQQQVQEAAAALDAAKQDLDAIVDEGQGQTAQLRAQIDAKRAELEPLQQTVNGARADADTVSTELALLTGDVDAARAALAEAEEAVARLRSAGVQTELDQALADKAAAESALAAATDLKRDAEARVADLQKRLSAARRACEEARASHQASASRGRLQEQLMRAARPGGALARAGLLGRLGDLGTIHQRFDVAVSTACGALDHLVVETAAGGRKCLQFLRDNNLGRATFIVLDEQHDARRAMDRRFDCPEGFQRLFDHVQPNEDRFAVAFYYGLRNTLVADDLDAATAVAYQGNKCVHRVVTLQGQMIDTSGVMSGGGKRVRRGGMSSSSAAAAAADPAPVAVNVPELEAQIVHMQNEFNAATAEARTASNDIRRLDGELTKLALRIAKLELELESAGPQAEALEARIEELRPRCELSADAADDAQRLETRLAAARADLAAAEGSAAALEAEVAQLQAQVLDVGGPRLREQQAAVDAATKALAAAKRGVSKANVDIKAAEKNAAKAVEAAAKAETDLEAVRAALADQKKQLAELEEAAAEVMAQIDSTQTMRDAAQASVKEAHTEFEAIKKEVTKIQTVQVDIQHQLEDYDRAAKDAEHKVAHWEAKLDEVRALHGSLGPAPVAVKSEGKGEEDEEGTLESKALDDDDDDDEEVDDDEEAEEQEEPELGDIADDQLPDADEVDTLKYDITILEQERDQLKDSVNMTAILEFKQKEAEYLSRVGDLEQVTAQRDAARARHEDLRRQRLEEFMAGFSVITLKLKEMYQMITLGGDAELELVDSLDPFSEGIVFSVRPSKKSWKNISNLSGGEKTLSSLALVFALHHYKPTPLYVMDEIDAALDFKNVSIVANYIKERTKNAQFVIISLRNNMFELADRLVGIYKTNNSTKSVTINPNKLAARAPGAAPARKPRALADRTNESLVDEE